MSDQNKATLVKANLAITQGEYEEFLSYCIEDTEWTFLGDKTLKGKEAVRQYMAEAYTDPLMQKIRYLDKLIDELAKGKAMEKILRQ